jgi:hypothetical protein
MCVFSCLLFVYSAFVHVSNIDSSYCSLLWRLKLRAQSAGFEILTPGVNGTEAAIATHQTYENTASFTKHTQGVPSRTREV